jgi:hypothetical protein
MNTSEQDLIKLLEEEDAILVLDNDMCYVRFECDDRNDELGESFDFNPTELVVILSNKLDIETEMC